MITINYPSRKPMIKEEGGKELIFCAVRKRWMQITPEEWVRQNFILYLTDVLQYPVSLIAVEKQLYLGELKKRFDIVVFDKTAQPFLIVECKEMNVALSETVLQQALRYNINLQAKYVVITNGNDCMAFEKQHGNFLPLEKMPVL